MKVVGFGFREAAITAVVVNGGIEGRKRGGAG